MLQLQRARKLRKTMTHAETKLWLKLRYQALGNFKFRRQVPIGPYIVDFVCYAASIIVEVDGGHHDEEKHMDYDQTRTVWLENQGFHVLRFWNNEVFENLEGVLEVILEACLHKMSTPY